MILASPHAFRAGTPVFAAPRRGHDLPTYARVLAQTSTHTASVLVTATSGGRQRGQRYTAPLGCLTPRPQGQHRKPPRPRFIRGWGR